LESLYQPTTQNRERKKERKRKRKREGEKREGTGVDFPLTVSVVDGVVRSE
jgi:hypothetical protein